jgi:methionyl-tRNA synthetase
VRAASHPNLEEVEERNWFFRLSKYQPFLQKLLAENLDFIQPESRRNEILGLLAQGLEDVSASRSRLDWAVPFPLPLSNGETQGTYVWFDALPNYLTATGFLTMATSNVGRRICTSSARTSRAFTP